MPGDAPAGGFLYIPAAPARVAQDAPYVQKEIFGPVLTVQPFDTEDEAVRLATAPLRPGRRPADP